MKKIPMSLAEREWHRAFASGVRKNISKTITEPVTNSYDSYKRISLLKLPQNTGLIYSILSLNHGDILDQTELLKDHKKTTEINIRIRLATVAARDLSKRECQVIDNAEGMNNEAFRTNLRYRGADVSGQATGAAVRGLFGHGLGDVIFGHKEGEIHSIYNDKYFCAKAKWEGDEKQPILWILDETPVNSKIRKRFFIPSHNGTMVRFCLHNECNIPREENLYAQLCNFYMLRLINADPSCHVILEELRGKRYTEKELIYQFPKGEVVGKFTEDIEIDKYPIKIEAIMLRATTELPGRYSGEERAAGLLVVDECDVVYDQTMFSYDNDTNIEYLYGIVKLTGVRPLIRNYLDKHHEALLTDSRDGFEPRGILYKQLSAALDPWIKQQVEEEQKRRQGDQRKLSADMTERVKEAFKELNDLYKEETGENIDSPGPGPDPIIPENIAFSEEEIVLRQGRPRRLYLLINPNKINIGAQIILECPSSQIRVEPEDINFDTVHIHNDRMGMIPVLLSSDILGASENITACAEGRDGNIYEAFTKVIDTISPEVVLPPTDGFEFRPDEVHVKPHVKRNLQLWVDTNVIPIGNDIILRMFDHGNGITFGSVHLTV